jgi:hypothetical protein
LTKQHISRAEALAVVGCCAAASIAATVWSWQHGALLNYGDAVAHLHIARRILDSHRPGLTQLGSVWLPLPHVLLIPFVAVFRWWANGFAAVIPSSLAWIASCFGIYRLARRWLDPMSAAVGLAFFAANPNLLYLQSTAMTEPLFLCEMVWASVWLVEWRTNLDAADLESESRRDATDRRLLYCIAAVLIAAVFTRYDGWVMAFLGWGAVAIALLRRDGLRSRTFWIATVLVIAAPIAWFAYNGVVFGDWLDFMRGPYSAKAIELRTATPGAGPPHPGWHNPWVAFLFFVKAAEMDAAALAWGNVLLAVCVTGTAWACVSARRRAFWWSLLLWLPVPFYAYSVAYGSVPIFLPVWWPHSWYNTRYGLELLPALALSVAFAAQMVVTVARKFKTNWAPYAVALLFTGVGINALLIVREKPAVYMEGTKNIEARRAYEFEIPGALRALLLSRPGGTVLMETSVYPQIVAFTGIPLRQTINESDKEFYTAALDAPAAHAAIVVAFEGDEIDKAVHAHPQGLEMSRHFSAPGQPSATIYVSDTPSSTTSRQGSTTMPAR